MDKLNRCLKSIRGKTDFVPEVGVVLGSGLGDFAETIETVAAVDYKEIEGFPTSTVEGHKGRFVFGYAGSVPVVVMQGRVHYYEGYSMQDVVLPTRLMGLLGIKKLILTNASGGLKKEFQPGELMIITDHIAAFVPNPLIGENLNELGPRFPDMSEIYSRRLQKVIKETAADLSISVREGVYVQFTGPSYETPAEVRMAKLLGGDAVGMSTAVEAIAARHMGLEVCGISCVTNPAAGISETPLNHEEVQENAAKASENFKKLVDQVIRRM